MAIPLCILYAPKGRITIYLRFNLMNKKKLKLHSLKLNLLACNPIKVFEVMKVQAYYIY